MAHHKRRRPKSRRSGCLMCKPFKFPGSASKHECATKNGRNEVVAREVLKRYEKGQEE